MWIVYVLGSRPRTRTEKHLFLRQVGMPNSLQTAFGLWRPRQDLNPLH